MIVATPMERLTAPRTITLQSTGTPLELFYDYDGRSTMRCWAYVRWRLADCSQRLSYGGPNEGLHPAGNHRARILVLITGVCAATSAHCLTCNSGYSLLWRLRGLGVHKPPDRVDTWKTTSDRRYILRDSFDALTIRSRRCPLASATLLRAVPNGTTTNALVTHFIQAA